MKYGGLGGIYDCLHPFARHSNKRAYGTALARRTVGLEHAERILWVVPLVLEIFAVGENSAVHLLGNLRPGLTRLMSQGRPRRHLVNLIIWEVLDVVLHADKMSHIQHPSCAHT